MKLLFNALFLSDQKVIYLQVVLLKQKNTNRRASLVAQWYKESTCQCGKHEFDLWSGKTPRAMGQLSMCAATSEPVLWSLGAETTEPRGCHC